MRRRRAVWGGSFFLCGIACFAVIPWVHRVQTERFWKTEPFYLCPVPVFADRALVRNDAYGKGRFGASRGKNGSRTHQGVDLLVKLDNPIKASKSGRVSRAEYDKGYGWFVELKHPDGRVSRYAHLARLAVSAGRWVGAGERLGDAGKSGNARDPRIRPHVHFEIRENNQALDPTGLMEPSLLVR